MARRLDRGRLVIATHNPGKLVEIADRCPVHRTLEAGSTVVTRAAPDAAVRPDEDPLVRQESAGTVG